MTEGTIRNSNVDERVFSDRWMKPGDTSFYKKIGNDATKATSRFIMDDNWFEIQNIGVEYRWDTDWLKKNLHAQSIRFALNFSNLWRFSSVRYERGISYPFARNMQGSVTFLF